MLKPKLHQPVKAGWENELAAAGFAAGRAGNCYTLNGITLRFMDRWISLESDALRKTADPLTRQMGKPALWKCVKAPTGHMRQLFEFPLSMVAGSAPDFDDEIEKPVSALQAMLAWALDTLNRERLNGWRPPTCRQVQSMLPDKGLTVQCDADARQGELVCNSQRLAFRFPILLRIPEDLCEARLYWLRRLLIETQSRWKLVRMGFNSDRLKTAALAEVDLSGAPPGVLPDLVKIALAALKGAVAWAVPSAAFLTDGAMDSSALAAGKYLQDRQVKNFDRKGGDENE
jgi:hypothetical protein